MRSASFIEPVRRIKWFRIEMDSATYISSRCIKLSFVVVIWAVSSLTVRGEEPLELDLWESKMIQFGHKWGEFLNPSSGRSLDQRLATEYYDSQWVFYQIADYTGEREPWYTYASYAEKVYRDEYLIPNDFKAQGFRRFPEGLYEDFVRGGDTTLEQLSLLRDNPAYSSISELTRGPDNRSGYSESMSREVAYAVESNVLAEKAGLSRVIEPDGKPRLASQVAMMENHLWEWRTQNFGKSKTGRVAPFMMGLTAYSLIEFYEWEVQNKRDPNAFWPQRHWPTIDAALTEVFTWLHEEAQVIPGEELAGSRMWLPLQRIGSATFRFMDRTIVGSGTPGPAPDVNQLIAPVYFWLFKHTADSKFKSVGDELFAGGARYGNCDWSGKHFNQQYRLSFRSLEWRAAGANIKSRSPQRQQKPISR